MTVPADQLEEHLAAARTVLTELELVEVHATVRPVSGHHSSILVPCAGAHGEPYLLKFSIPPAEDHCYPVGVRPQDYQRREAAFYRFLDTIDPQRRQLPAPKTVLLDAKDPPRWILLERLASAVGPLEEILTQDHTLAVLREIQNIPLDKLLGRRNLPLQRWEAVSLLERARLMYDPVLFVIGERRWTRIQSFYGEALRWTETRRAVLVHGDFTEDNILVDADDRPYLLDFERIGLGSEDHDFAWFWAHSTRSTEWKRQLLERYLANRVGSDRIRSEWAMRSAWVYLALRRLRFSYMVHGTEDPNAERNLGLLDMALESGAAAFGAGG